MSGFVADARAAGAALRELFEPTPLQRNDYLSAKHGAEVWLKREDLSPVRSYKLRGAFNAMRKALGARPERRRFVCASAGNHAQGMAFETRAPGDFQGLKARMTQSGFTWLDITDDPVLTSLII